MKATQENLTKAKFMKPETKADAVWLAGLEICGFINFSEVARKYFGKTSQWLTQRLHGNEVNGRPAQFKPEEIATFATALKDMANKLNTATTRIEQTPE